MNRAEGKYDIGIDDLERSAHVPVAEQISEQPEPPPPSPVADEELDRQRLLGVTSAGRLRVR